MPLTCPDHRGLTTYFSWPPARLFPPTFFLFLLGSKGQIKEWVGWWVGWWQESIRMGGGVPMCFNPFTSTLKSQNPTHILPTQTLPPWHSWNAEAFFFFANLGNYHSGHGAQNRDRDPGRCTVTARVADAPLCFVLPKPDLPTNSSLTSLKHTIFDGYNACPLVYCVTPGIPSIPMHCVGMLGRIMAHHWLCFVWNILTKLSFVAALLSSFFTERRCIFQGLWINVYLPRCLKTHLGPLWLLQTCLIYTVDPQ